MKKILVPTDYTALSVNSLDFALDLAKASGSQVDLVYFMDTPIEEATFREQLHGADEEKAGMYDLDKIRGHHAKLNEIVEAKKSSGVTIKAEVAGRGVVNGCDKYVSTHDIDLIVIGADEIKRNKTDFPISVCQELTQHLKIPVIALTEHVEYVDLTKVVLALDIVDEKYESKTVPTVNSIADSFGAKIVLLNVVKPGKHDLMALEKGLHHFAAEAKIKDYEVTVIENNDDLDTILHYADDIGAGLIATISDGRPEIFRFFKDSFATTVVKATDIPVLVLNKKNL